MSSALEEENLTMLQPRRGAQLDGLCELIANRDRTAPTPLLARLHCRQPERPERTLHLYGSGYPVWRHCDQKWHPGGTEGARLGVLDLHTEERGRNRHPQP